MMWVVNATPRLLYPREMAPVPIVKEDGWAPGPDWRRETFLPPPGLEPRTVQPVASRYTEDAIPTPVWKIYSV